MSTLPPADLELLSAYLDNELSPAERAALDARLAVEADLRAELDALRQVTALVGMLPVYRAPRDFTLDPAVYGRAAETAAPAPRRTYATRVYRAASLVSALAAALVFLIGVLGVLSQQMMPPLASAPAALQQENVASQPQAQATSIAAMPRDARTPTPALLSPPDEDAAAPGGMADEAAEEEAADDALAAGDMAEAEVSPDMTLAEGADAAMAAEMAEPDSAGGAGDALPAASPTAAGQGIGSGGGVESPPTATAPPADGAAASEESAPAAALPTQTALAFAVQPTATVPASPTLTGTPTPAPTQAPTQAPTATVAESTARDTAEAAPFQLDPGILIGASVALLALAVGFFALARRATR